MSTICLTSWLPKAYDYDFLRDAFAARGSKLLSPHRVTRSKPPRDQEQIGRHYKRRWAVERLFSWLAAWRRLATRYEKRAEHYWQWLCLGISLIYTRRRFLAMTSSGDHAICPQSCSRIFSTW